MDATCKTCPFWDANEGDRLNVATVAARECHVRSPAAFTVAVRREDEPRGGERDARWPWTEPDNWCGEHPLRQRDRLAAMFAAGSLADGWAPDRPEKWAARYYALADALIAEAARSPAPAPEGGERLTDFQRGERFMRERVADLGPVSADVVRRLPLLGDPGPQTDEDVRALLERARRNVQPLLDAAENARRRAESEPLPPLRAPSPGEEGR